MAPQMLEIKYECQHKSCYVNCREGILCLEEGLFNDLKAAYLEEGLFRSPRGVCRLGFSQPFKVIMMQPLGEGPIEQASSALDPADNPLLVLVEEHKVINRKLEEVEDHLRKRDMDALWVSTKELENDLVLHSGIKEEEVLFGLSKGLLPFGETLVDIIREEHREIISLLHNFRVAMEINEINDGIIDSVIVSLRGHIRKEDQEFFEMVDKCLDKAMRRDLAEGMRKIEAEFTPVPIAEMVKRVNEERGAFNEEIIALRELTHQGCCH